MTATGIVSGPGVVSVNDQTGVVLLDADDVTADVEGAAAAAQSAAQAFATNAANAALTAANAATAAALTALAPGAWVLSGPTPATDITLAAAWTADISGTYFPFSFRRGAYGRLEGSGRITTTTNYVSGVTIFTLPTALRPDKDLILDVRVGGSGAAGAFLSIAATTGVCTLTSSFTAGALSWLQFDAFSARRAT
jgi:hypothetical protein